MEAPTTTDTKQMGKTFTPEVLWAQRSSATEPEKNVILLTISVPDVDPKKMELDIQPTYLKFSGYSATVKVNYEVKLDFYAEIEPKETRLNHNSSKIEMVLQKAEAKEEYWPRLLKDKVKVHFLKTDFNKWVDEDEQNEEPEADDAMAGMGGMPPGAGGAGGMPGMGGMGGGDGGFGGIDFSKLGGEGGGMGGMDMSQLQAMMGGQGGMPGMGGMGGDDDDDGDDDEEMPGLEDEEGKAKAETGSGPGSQAAAGAAPAAGASATKTSSKIEEVE
ncbi:hypothetical protein MBLNU230_g1762t1 [Neophaeotheca triangularis]